MNEETEINSEEIMTEYFNQKNYEVLENKNMILIFKKTVFFKYLKLWKSFSKEFYVWKEDKKGQMNIIKELVGGRKK